MLLAGPRYRRARLATRRRHRLRSARRAERRGRRLAEHRHQPWRLDRHRTRRCSTDLRALRIVLRRHRGQSRSSRGALVEAGAREVSAPWSRAARPARPGPASPARIRVVGQAEVSRPESRSKTARSAAYSSASDWRSSAVGAVPHQLGAGVPVAQRRVLLEARQPEVVGGAVHRGVEDASIERNSSSSHCSRGNTANPRSQLRAVVAAGDPGHVLVAHRLDVGRHRVGQRRGPELGEEARPVRPVGVPRPQHRPVGEQPLQRVAEHRDQRHVRLVGAHPLQRVGPEQVDRRLESPTIGGPWPAAARCSRARSRGAPSRRTRR